MGRGRRRRVSSVGTPPPLAPEDTRPRHDSERKSVTRPSAWSLSLLRALEWRRFEDLTAAYFSELGFNAQTTGLGADGGVDVKLYLDGQMTPAVLVQCKAWTPNQPVGVKLVRELFGVMAADGVARGVFVTTSTFTDDALEFGRDQPLDLIDGEAFLKLIETLTPEAQARLLARATEGDYTTPSCPSCGEKMIRRSAGKGRMVGEQFWGCRHFPRCRGKLYVRSQES